MKDFENLLQQLEAGTISDQDLDRLEEHLASDHEARERFVDHSQIGGLLYALAQSEPSKSLENFSPQPEDHQAENELGKGEKMLTRFKFVAAIALLIALSFFFLNRFNDSESQRADSSREGSSSKLSSEKIKQAKQDRYDQVVNNLSGGASQAHPENAQGNPDGASAQERISFNQHVRPILSDNCFFCHGPDAAERKGDLRLDTEQGMLDVVVKGKPRESELLTRIFHRDEDEIMPPPDSSRTLSAKEMDILRRWIEQGAEWQEHWAFEPPTKPKGDGIDYFVEKQLERRGMQLSPQASKHSLIRRATLDLTGLPPSLKEIEEFVSDESPDAYEKLLDRLLASPRYAERMTWQWLEAARYADTDGYQNDGPRQMWRWRDWVLDAYGKNMPFDQFTIEQLAGDLLPEPSLQQKIATGFNRNHRYNSEAGLVIEEFLLENAVDRVDTTSTVWMGVTMACARCHDHKYDPFSQKEYYQMLSFFDAIPESGRAIKYGNSEPWIKAPTAEQLDRLEEFDNKIADAQSQLAKWEPEILSRMKKAVAGKDSRPLLAKGLAYHYAKTEPLITDGEKSQELRKKPESFNGDSRFSIALRVTPGQVDSGPIFSSEAKGTGRRGIFARYRDGHLRFAIVGGWIAAVTMLETVDTFQAGEQVHLVFTNDGTQRAKGVKMYVNGELAKTKTIYNTNSNKGVKSGSLKFGASKYLGTWKGEVEDFRFYRDQTLTAKEAKILAKGFDARQWVLEYGGEDDKITKTWKSLEKIKDERIKFHDSIQTSMVMEELEKLEPTRIRVRGEYHNLGEPVQSDVPEIFPELPAGYPRNRLGLAKWLVSGEHPLTARVAVNRYWQMLFGQGLVKTAEDFGVQGALPSHPELLDWLAHYFVDSAWDVQAVLKEIMMSQTYRQSSVISSEMLEKDPENKWLARAPRLKLAGNVLRDQALFSSGLLVEKLGGASVKPYQPAKLWSEVSNFKYSVDKGENLYRRSVYTYWKRTLAPPSMAILDTADREWCSVKPKTTNTPLQALTLLNETAFFEAARKLGEILLQEGGETVEQRVRYGFLRVVGREASSRELEILKGAWENYLDEAKKDPDIMKKMGTVGESKVDQQLDSAELAAATAFANVLFNLEEVSVRE